MRLQLLVFALSLSACASTEPAIGYDLSRAAETQKVKAPVAKKTVPEDVVMQASGTLKIVRLSDSSELNAPTYERELLNYDAVCAGEEHDSASAHYAELELIEHLARRAVDLGLEVGVGLEMWSQEWQPALIAFSKGRLSSAELVRKTDYEQDWGYPFAYYRPQLERARDLGLPLIALNADPDTVRKVATEGIDALNRHERRQLPELDLADKEHRERFSEAMRGHPGVDANDFDNFYTAQVMWDETMASRATAWLDVHAPMRRQLILAGRAHCQRSAIPKRMERRGTRRVAAVWLGSAPPPAAERSYYDYAVIVQSTPQPNQPNNALQLKPQRHRHIDADGGEIVPS